MYFEMESFYAYEVENIIMVENLYLDIISSQKL
jgi:hypothetical protein